MTAMFWSAPAIICAVRMRLMFAIVAVFLVIGHTGPLLSPYGRVNVASTEIVNIDKLYKGGF